MVKIKRLHLLPIRLKKTFLKVETLNNLNTKNPNHYLFKTQVLEVGILGGVNLTKLERLRVTLSVTKASNTSEGTVRHSLDLYNDNQVEKFVRTIAERLSIGTSEVRKTLEELTRSLESYRFVGLQEDQNIQNPKPRELSALEEKEAIAFLKSKDLLKRTNELIGKSGVIGEEVNRLLMYIIFTSRKTSNPLHCISFGSSGVGKTHLQSKVAELIPLEDKIEITVLSANAFYYFNRTELQNKLILIEDLDGAESVLYPLRELQSKKRITKTVVHKDVSGKTKTIHLTVEGPVSVSGCTTKESVYEDNSNRSFLLYIDESEVQDQKIMNYQRRASAGIISKETEQESQNQLLNVQKVLKPIKVVNPYALHLELPSSVFKPRRTNSHYLQFIEAITFYKQYQREERVNEETGEIYIETTLEDIKQANELILEVLLRKSDSLTGACRNYLENLKQYLEEHKQSTFSNAEIRRNLRVKESTLRNYNKQLLLEGYIKQVKKVKERSYRYEIIDIAEYKELKDQIDKALNTCLSRLSTASRK